MRWALLMVVLIAAALEAGCGRTPESLGITGPAAPTPLPAPTPDEANVPPPGIPASGANSDDDQRYYHYN
jgi:hypothetical protein